MSQVCSQINNELKNIIKMLGLWLSTFKSMYGILYVHKYNLNLALIKWRSLIHQRVTHAPNRSAKCIKNGIEKKAIL